MTHLKKALILSTIVCLSQTPALLHSQNISKLIKNGVEINLPRTADFIPVDTLISNQIKTNGTFNIITYSIGDDFNNHISLYGTYELSPKKIPVQTFYTIKKYMNDKLNDPEKVFNNAKKEEIFYKSFSILKQMNANDSGMLKKITESYEQTKNKGIDKIWDIEKPTIVYNNTCGIISNYNIKLKTGFQDYYSSIQIACILLNNHYIGVSATFDAFSKEEYDKTVNKINNLFTELIRLNPSKNTL